MLGTLVFFLNIISSTLEIIFITNKILKIIFIVFQRRKNTVKRIINENIASCYK